MCTKLSTMAWYKKPPGGPSSNDPSNEPVEHQGGPYPTPTSPGFDAVHAAEELDEVLGQQGGAESDGYIRTLESEIEGLQTVLTQKEALLARAEGKLAENDDEIERIKHRLKAEAEQQVDTRVNAAIEEILDIGDDLARAIDSAKAMDHNPAVVEGIELVRQSFQKRLGKLGVSPMNALGATFDPACHEAVSMLPVDDPAQNNVVLAVMHEGWMRHGKVLREARVAVGKLTS